MKRQHRIHHHYSFTFWRHQNSQMIVLMGITLALCIFMISAIPSKISETSYAVPQGRSDSLALEFINLREIFGTTLNYYLITMHLEPDPSPNPNILYYGKNGKYTPVFDTYHSIVVIAQRFQTIELQYGRVFNVNMLTTDTRPYYSHLSEEGPVYYIDVKLALRDRYSSIEETVRYYLVFNEEIY